MKSRTYLILSGGLGNQLFQFASAYSLCKAWKRELALVNYWFTRTPQRGPSLERFARRSELYNFPEVSNKTVVASELEQNVVYNVTRLMRRFPALRLDRWHLDLGHEDPDYRFDRSLLNRPRDVLSGYYQCLEYFSPHCIQDLRALIRLSDSAERDLAVIVEGLRRDCGRVVMMHVRRGDVLSPNNGWAGLLSPSYYVYAIRSLGYSMKNAMVFSDDIDWCSSVAEFSGAFFVREDEPSRGLRLMSYCDDFVIAGSTFSLWGALLGNDPEKKVIAPAPFFKEHLHSELERFIIPENWIRAPAQYL